MGSCLTRKKKNLSQLTLDIIRWYLKKKIHKAHHKSNILKKKIIIDGFSGNS